MSTTIERPETITAPEWLWPGQAPEEDPVLAVLRATEKILQRRGWVKGKAVAEDGRVCLVNAIGVAVRKWEGDRTRRTFLYHRVDREIRSAIRVFSPPIHRWNDRPWRREAAVHRVIHRAIKRREEHLLAQS